MIAPSATVLAKRTAALATLATRRAALAAHVSRLAPADAARELDGIVRLVRGGSVEAAELGVSLASLLVAEIETIDRPAVRAAASSLGLGLVAAQLSEPPARRALGPHGRLPEASVPWHYARTGWLLDKLGPNARTGGFRRPAWWETRWLARLADHPSARAIEALLDAPLTPQRVVVAVAARRPTTPELAFVIARSDRWLPHEPVREALVSNPFVASRVALALAPTVGAAVLRGLVAATAPGEPLHELCAGLLGA